MTGVFHDGPAFALAILGALIFFAGTMGVITALFARDPKQRR